MDWSTIITIVLGSSVLGAALNSLLGWLTKRADRTSQATYMALNLSHLFEKYAYVCLSALESHDAAEIFREEIGAYIKKVPDFPELPDYEYQVFDLVILDKVFDFPQQVNFAAESLSSAFEILDGQDALWEGYKSCLELASEALAIADEIRQRYRLKTRSLSFGRYSVRGRISERVSEMNS